MINKYIWDLYLKAGGEDTVSFFDMNFNNQVSFEYPEKIAEFHKVYHPDWTYSEGDIKDKVQDAILDTVNDFPLIENKKINRVESIINRLIKDIKKFQKTDKRVLSNFTYMMAYYTTMLSFQYPGLFYPYYFQYNFNFFKMIAEEFGIDLPEIPKRNNYLGRIKYYGVICESLKKFQDENNLTYSELLAFLYDFAPKYLGGYNSYIEKEIEHPKGAYVIGANYNDLHFQRNPNALIDEDAITFWQCNPDTRVGDSVVMYFTTPDSSIDYIWRSVSKGFNDPFFYYYHLVYISHPKKVKGIGIKQLKSDKTLNQMSIVRKNMQGVDGKEIFPSDYNYMLDLMDSNLDRIDFGSVRLKKNYKSEDDFVKRYVLPLVEDLGYSIEDYEEQVNIQVGNANTPFKLIPDIVLMPKYVKNTLTCYAVIEAKYSIKSQKALEEAQNQVRSYSRQLQSRYAVVISMEKIWVMSDKDKYDDIVFEAYLGDLKNPDIFRKLFTFIGKPEFDR